MKPLISVIVPIYKVEKYINQCIDSILAQTYKNLEVILVDDGSPDNCPKICDEYAKLDNRIRVIHKENGGLSDARNAGLEIAKGEYIGFVDSDDWIAPDMYEYMYNGIQKYSADIVSCGYFECLDKSNFAGGYYNPEDRLYKEKEAIEALLLLKIPNYAWNKLYKRSLWTDDIRYPKGRLYEDVLTTYKLFEKSKLTVALSEPKYNYRINDKSITGNISIKNKIESIKSRIERFTILKDKYKEHQLFMLKDIYRFIPDLSKSIYKQNKKEFYKYKEEIHNISTFLKKYKKEIWKEAELKSIQKISYNFMLKKNRINWKTAGVLENIITIESKILNIKLVKMIKKLINEFKGNNRKRYYYKICTKFPLRKVAFVESRGGGDLAGNIFEIAQELCARGIKVYLSVDPKWINKVKEILITGNFNGLKIVPKFSRAYYKALATSKYWFNDMVFEDTIIKRNGQIYINVWHGTPLKKLDFDIKDQRHNSGGASRDFLKCDYLAVPSKFLFQKLLSSGCIENIFKGKALYSGYPRNSVFFDTNKREKVRKELKIEDKEIFVYMPTWRGNLLNHSKTSGQYSIEKILDFFEQNLKDNQIMLVKLHNYAVEKINYNRYKKVQPFPTQFDTYTVLNTADCLITDYSSVFFDYANTRKKIILFTHDKETYIKERGLYLDLDELPYPKVETYDELKKELNIQKDYDDSKFINEFCTYDCADSVKKMLDYVINKKEVCHTEQIVPNGKKNVLLYDADIKLRIIGFRDSEEFLKNIDTKETNYYYCFPQWKLKSTPSFIRNIRDDIYLFSFTTKPITLWTEKIIMKITGKKCLRAIKTRELNRQIYGDVFDEIQVLR